MKNLICLLFIAVLMSACSNDPFTNDAITEDTAGLILVDLNSADQFVPAGRAAQAEEDHCAVAEIRDNQGKVCATIKVIPDPETEEFIFRVECINNMMQSFKMYIGPEKGSPSNGMEKFEIDEYFKYGKVSADFRIPFEKLNENTFIESKMILIDEYYNEVGFGKGRLSGGMAGCYETVTTLECHDGENMNFFIPLQESTSGTYPSAGSEEDIITLSPDNPVSEGYLDIELNFTDLPSNISEANLSMSFYDLDLMTDNIHAGGNEINFSETLTLMDQSGKILYELNGSGEEDGDFDWTVIIPNYAFTDKSLTLYLRLTAKCELVKGSGIQLINTYESIEDVNLCLSLIEKK